MKHKTFFTVLVLVALLTVSISTVAQNDAESRTGIRPDAPSFAIRGPYSVGTMEMVLENDERPLPFTIWYPALNPDGLEEVHTYVMNYPGALVGLEAHGHALLDATPNTADGPYPLFIYAHGFMGVRAGYVAFMEQLASHGFIAIAADHIGTTIAADLSSPDSVWPVLYTVPQDFGLIIDYAETLNSDGVFTSMIDTERVAVGGHSAGGFSSLMAAGGLLDLNYLADECQNGAQVNDCDFFVPYLQEIAESLGLDAPPEGLWPSVRDERIDAVIPMAPDQILFGPEGLGQLTIHTLYFVGSGDQSIPPSTYNTWFPSLGSEVAYMVELENASHGIYVNSCDTIPMIVEWGAFGVCADPVWDRNRAHDLINHYMTAFLLWQLNGDENAAAVFGSDTESFLGVNVIEH